ncbi:MAG: cohesin domain-containing protein [bacterium]
MKSYCFIIIIIVLLGISSQFCFSIEMKVNDASGYPGETRQIQIIINDLTGLVFVASIIAIDIELTYNPNVLLAKNIIKGDIIPPEWMIIGNTQNPGKIMIQMMSGLRNGEFIELNETGEIAKITFQVANNVQGGQSSPLILSKVYINENADIVTKVNGTFVVLGNQQNTIFTLRLQPGWNLISLPINIENTNIDAFLNKISGKYESIWSWDMQNEWKKYIYNAPSWLNDLSMIQPRKGYWIKMFSQATIDISGQELNNQSIQLYKGWNLVGFSSLRQMQVNSALLSITGYYNSIWGYDPYISDWKKLIIGAPNQINNLSILKPGEGYWIDAKDNIIWNVNSSIISSPANFNANHDNYHDMPKIPCLIYGEINFVEFESANLNDEIYVELRCDGSLLFKYRIKEKNGNHYNYALYCPESLFGKSLDISFIFNKKLVYSDKIICGHSGDLIRLDINNVFSPKQNLLYQNYPNPFNPETWIPYVVKETSKVQIVIYDVNYHVIKTLDLGYKLPGFYTTKDKSAYWDGKNDLGEPVKSGVYFYSIKIGNYSSTRKMVLLR